MAGAKTFRPDPDVEAKFSREKNKSQVVNEALRQYYEIKERGVRLPTEREMSKGQTTVVTPKIPNKKRRFRIPVGDVISYGIYRLDDETRVSADTPLYVYKPQEGYSHIAKSVYWWCPPNKINDVVALAKPFVDSGGFAVYVGQPGKGSDYMPEVITEDRQERRQGGAFSVSSKMIPALTGDKLIVLDITDTDKAWTILQQRSDLPCAVRCDVFRYSDDEYYRKVFDVANDYFIYYSHHEKPVNLTSHSKSEKEILEELHGV